MIRKKIHLTLGVVIFWLCTLMVNTVTAQEHADSSAFLLSQDSVVWQVTVADTALTVPPDSLIPLPAGNYLLKLRPINDHLWQRKGFQMRAELYAGDTLKIAAPKVTLPAFPLRSYKINPHPMRNFWAKVRFRNTRQYSKPVLLSTAVLTNWLAFYLKRKADDNYRKYQQTSGLSEMKNFYDKTRQLDLYSNISLSVSAASLLSFFYLIIEE